MFKTLISLYEGAQAVIGTARMVMNGQCMPLADLHHTVKLTRDADQFAHHPIAFDAGSDEGCATASWLVHLAAKNGAWHGVAWSLLRNEQLGHGLIKKLRVRSERRVPDIANAHPGEFRARYGGGPIVDLVLGIDKLRADGMVEVITLEDEDYLVPTDKLLERAMSDLHQSYYA